jgi:hypothetical protein
VPLVSVLLAAHDDAAFLGEAVGSILGQTLRDLELIVVDDASSDGTPALLDAIDDGRLRVVRNEEQAGLAASLNRGLDLAGGRYVARLDADDVALPERLERQVERIEGEPRAAVVGTAIADLDEDGRTGATHVLPGRATPLRWHALFSSPFFELLAGHGLHYDPSYLESEDYDLWTRLFAFADGANLTAPLVLKRVHAGQASLRRSELQESFQRKIALREIARVAPHVDAEEAWRVGARRPGGSRGAFVSLLRTFERQYGRDWDVRRAALKAIVR